MSFYSNSPGISPNLFTPPSSSISQQHQYENYQKSQPQQPLSHSLSTASNSFSQISQGASLNLLNNCEDLELTTQEQLHHSQYDQLIKVCQKQTLLDSPQGIQDFDANFSFKNQNNSNIYCNLSKLNTCDDSDDDDIFVNSSKQHLIQQQQTEEDVKLSSPMFQSQSFPNQQQYQQIQNYQQQQQQQQQQYNLQDATPFYPQQTNQQAPLILQNDFNLNIKEEQYYKEEDNNQLQQLNFNFNLNQQQNQPQTCTYTLIDGNNNNQNVKKESNLNLQTDEFGDFSRFKLNNLSNNYCQNNNYTDDEFNLSNQQQHQQQQFPHQQLTKAIKKKKPSLCKQINHNNFNVKEELMESNSPYSKKQSQLKRKNSKQQQQTEKKTRINTSHVPLNMFNSLHMHLIKIYQKVACTCSSQSPQNVVEHNKPNYSFDFQYTAKETCVGEQCRRCRDLEILTVIKKSQRKNIQTFRNLWQDSVRIQKLTEHFLLYYSQTRFLSNTQYRSTQSANALYQCLPTFLEGSRNYLHFYKLQP